MQRLDQIKALIGRGVMHLVVDQLSEAETAFTQAIELDAKAASEHFVYEIPGNAATILENPKGAIFFLYWGQALRIYNNVRKDKDKHDTYREAIAHFTTAMTINPAYIHAYLWRARTFMQIDYVNEAMDDYYHVLAFLLKKLFVNRNATIDIATSVAAEFYAIFNKIVAATKDNVPALLGCGISQYILGDFNLALIRFRQVIALHEVGVAMSAEQLADAYYYAGAACGKLQMYDAACGYYELAVTSNQPRIVARAVPDEQQAHSTGWRNLLFSRLTLRTQQPTAIEMTPLDVDGAALQENTFHP